MVPRFLKSLKQHTERSIFGTDGICDREEWCAESDERERIKLLEREVRELRQANEILRKASAYFAMAELDRRSKP
jgi:transposase-like protein